MGQAPCRHLGGVRLCEAIGDEPGHHRSARVTASEAGARATAFTGAGAWLPGRGSRVGAAMPVVPGMRVHLGRFGRGIGVNARRTGLRHHLLSEQAKAQQPHERARISLHRHSVA